MNTQTRGEKGPRLRRTLSLGNLILYVPVFARKISSALAFIRTSPNSPSETTSIAS